METAQRTRCSRSSAKSYGNSATYKMLKKFCQVIWKQRNVQDVQEVLPSFMETAQRTRCLRSSAKSYGNSATYKMLRSSAKFWCLRIAKQKGPNERPSGNQILWSVERNGCWTLFVEGGRKEGNEMDVRLYLSKEGGGGGALIKNVLEQFAFI